VNLADLFRIKGVAEEYSDLLEEAGVDTVRELAQRNPKNLYRAMVDKNEAKKLVRRLPSEGQVADWVAQAKKLPRVVKY
jgi:predicted flap endonuclease-1-like 5' DNA nuclease